MPSFHSRHTINIAAAFMLAASMTAPGCNEANDEATALNRAYTTFMVSRAEFEPSAVINPESEYMVVVGDIQEYTATTTLLPYLTKSLDWVRCQQSYFGNIACVVQNGDVTNNNYPYQWASATNAFSHLGDSTLWVWTTGNHDYDWCDIRIDDRNSTMFNDFAGSPMLSAAEKTLFEEGDLANMIVHHPFPEHGNLDLMILEFGPRPQVVEWAADFAASHPERHFILITHEWLWLDGSRIDLGSSAKIQFADIPCSSPEEVWNRLVYPNDNVRCVVCGHNGFCLHLKTPNAAGRQVSQVLFNLQYQLNGGNGMLQLWEFPKGKDYAEVLVYYSLAEHILPDHDKRFRVEL